MTIEEAFGIVLRKLRRERSLSQEKLSLISNLDRTFISKIEGGKQQPSLLTIFALANALNVTSSSIVLEAEFILNINHPDIFKSEYCRWKFDCISSPKRIMAENIDNYRGAETILIAEDGKDLRDMMSSILTDCGYNVILAKDGQNAIDVLHADKDNIRLIVMDIVMPNKDGITAYNEIKSLHKDIKIVMISGYNGQKLNSADGMFILQKPFSYIDLIKNIRNALDKT